MRTGKLIRKIYMECPVCGMEHEVSEYERTATLTIKGEKVTYPENYYYCEQADEDECEFESGAMLNANLLRARNAYRVLHGLLTSDEIVAIREAYGLSQVDLARLLGWGEATISRYESKSIQDEAYDLMLRLVRDNPMKALELLKKNSGNFTKTKYEEIKRKILEKIDAYGKEFLSRQSLEGDYVNFEDLSDLNGYALLNIDKIEAVVSYLAERVSDLFKVKLMKMLWYADALCFQRRGSAMTGLVYSHEAMGALPVGHYSLMNLEHLNVREEMSRNFDSMQHIYPCEQADISILDDEEKEILDTVIAKFKNMKARGIVEYMHEEQAYIETRPGEVIPFHLAGKIREL